MTFEDRCGGSGCGTVGTSSDPTFMPVSFSCTVSCPWLQYSDRARTRAKAKQITVSYGSLLVATGSSVRCVDALDVALPRKQSDAAFVWLCASVQGIFQVSYRFVRMDNRTPRAKASPSGLEICSWPTLGEQLRAPVHAWDLLAPPLTSLHGTNKMLYLFFLPFNEVL